MVDVFRRSDTVPPVVDEAIEIGAKYIWMQDGVEHEEAAKKAEEAGVQVIMNKLNYARASPPVRRPEQRRASSLRVSVVAGLA